jgi:membrane-associated phospholipid phosphatase
MMNRESKLHPLLLLWGALIVLVVAFFCDTAVDDWVRANRDATWETLAKMCSRYFAWHWLMAAGAISLLLAWWRGRRDLMRLFAVMMISASLAGLAADFLRGATGRTRPYVQDAEQGFYGVRKEGQWLIIKHAYNSFPSGHTTAISAFTVPLLLWRRWLALLAIPLVVIVAASRVYLGAHHPSDIVAGAILGTLVAVWVWRRLMTRLSGMRLFGAARAGS